MPAAAPDANASPEYEPPRRFGSRSHVIPLVLLGVIVAVVWVGRRPVGLVAAGERAPNFTASTIDGERVELTDYRGKVVLVNIWATWCLPCREEMPSMEALYRDLGGDDFEILAVSVDDFPGGVEGVGPRGASKRRLAEFAEEYDLTFPVLHDESGTLERLYRTTGVPESFLLDREGVIVRRIAGATIWDHARYRELIKRLAAS